MLDWGAELHGELDLVNYNVSLGSGSGKWFSRKDDTYMSVGRIALNADHPLLNDLPLQIGASGLSARIQSADGLIERWRAGLDFQYSGPVSILMEGSIGQDSSADDPSGDSQEAISLLAEINWRSMDERWLVYVQQRYLSLEQREGEPEESPQGGEGNLTEEESALAHIEMAILDQPSSTVAVKESATFGVRYMPIRDLYLASEVITLGGSSSPMLRAQIRYRW